MKTNARRFMKIALAAAIALGAGFAVAPASAQVRAAYVKNVDEPGRLPYQTTIGFVGGPRATYCPTQITCIFGLPVVPAGKRLIVEHVSALVLFSAAPLTVIAFSPENATAINSHDITTIVPATWVLSHRNTGTYNFYSMQSAVRAYFEAGATPYLKIFVDDAVFSSDTFSTISVQGYLIDAAN